jgi:hypothetical protein
VRYLYSLSEQLLTKVDTSEVIQSHCLHLLEVVGMKMLIMQNFPYQHVIYTQGVCTTLDTSVRCLRGCPQGCLLGLKLPVWEKLLIHLASLSCIPSGFLIDEKYLGVVCICLDVCHSSFPIYDRHTNEEETTKQILGMVRDCIM